MSNATHPFAPEEIMAYVDGELSAGRAESFASHVDECADCRELAASLRNTSETLAHWTASTAPVNGQFEERLRVAAARNSTLGESVSFGIFERSKLWTWKQWTGGLAAAAALGVVLVAMAIPNRLTRPAHFMSLSIHERGKNIVATGRGFGNGPMGKPQAREEKAMKKVQQPLGQEGFEPPTQSSAEVPIAGALRAKVERNVFSFGDVIDRQSRVSAGPLIARMVSLSIVAKDFDAARLALDAVLGRHNGYAAELNVATPEGAARTLQVSLRIPAPRLAAAVAELKALGRVEAETQNGEEVTQQHADLVARLKNSRETEQRLQDVLRTRTGKVKEVLEVEEEIARVRGEIEQMEAEQKNLEHRVDFATIDLKLAEEYKAQLSSRAPSVAMQLRNSTVNGFRSAFLSLLGMVLFFAESGPTLLLWLLILLFPGWLFWRRYQRSLAMGSSVVG